MPNVPESPNFEAIIAFGNLGNRAGLRITMPQTAIVYPNTATALVADVGLAPATVTTSQFGLLKDAGISEALVDTAIHLLLEGEVNGPYQSSFDLLKSETAIGDGSLSMLRETPIMVIPDTDAQEAQAIEVPPEVGQRVPKSGGSFCGF